MYPGLTFDKKKHRYYYYGDPVPSVTAITGVLSKPYLLPWAVNQTVERVRQHWTPDVAHSHSYIEDVLREAKESRKESSGKAASIGTAAHNWIETYIKSKIRGSRRTFPLPTGPELIPVQEFLRWESQHEVIYLSSERKLFNYAHIYAGTADVLAMVDDRLTVIDFKTSKSIYADYYLQIAAYVDAIEREDAEEGVEGLILHIPKEDVGFTIRRVDADELVDLFVSFLAAKRLYEFQQEYR